MAELVSNLLPKLPGAAWLHSTQFKAGEMKHSWSTVGKHPVTLISDGKQHFGIEDLAICPFVIPH